jgi:hypothetical protein
MHVNWVATAELHDRVTPTIGNLGVVAIGVLPPES